MVCGLLLVFLVGVDWWTCLLLIGEVKLLRPLEFIVLLQILHLYLLCLILAYLYFTVLSQSFLVILR